METTVCREATIHKATHRQVPIPHALRSVQVALGLLHALRLVQVAHGLHNVPRLVRVVVVAVRPLPRIMDCLARNG